MDNFKGLLQLLGIKQQSSPTQSSEKGKQPAQTGWKDAGGGKFLPDYSQSPKYKTLPQNNQTSSIAKILGVQQSQDSPQPSSTSTPDPKEVEKNIRSGFATYGGGKIPKSIEAFIPQMVEATQKYPIYAQHPYLLPQLTILETSAGQNVTRPNNLVNWGINYPGNNEQFAKMSPAQVFGKAISGLGERDPNYAKVRQTGDLKQFAKTYEPANPDYYNNLVKGMQTFQNQK